MIQLHEQGVYYFDDQIYLENEKRDNPSFDANAGKKKTVAYKIMQAHNHSGNDRILELKFDSIASHDITFVGIIQTAKASGIEKFPIPYILTNCHNSLCAVGGTINADDHFFGLSAAKKYGGTFVPPHVAVIHQYMREMMAGGGKMILGSDSHTRYGALGTMAIGEGGGELVQQLLNKTYDTNYPEIVGVHLTGKPKPGVGPQDVALSLIGKVFANGFVKNRVMEFIGPGIANLSVEFRNGIDVMTTETTCLSSIWATDNQVQDYLATHYRGNDYQELKPENGAYYDRFITIDLDQIECMIALPFHPSNVFSIRELNENLEDILHETEVRGQALLEGTDVSFTLTDKIRNGRLFAEQGSIAGCAGGTYDNICAAANILAGKSVGNEEFSLSVYPSSMPVYQCLMDNGSASTLMTAGAIFKTAFCGPCFGGDTPANNTLSIRHTTRNFIHREGSKPQDGQLSSVALMDARSIAASAVNHGLITAATDLVQEEKAIPKYFFNKEIYENRVFQAHDKAQQDLPLRIGPNITEWPEFNALTDDMLLKVTAVLKDPVTTTDELIPSGDTSSYRSNPIKLSEFTLSRKDPQYVPRAKEIREVEQTRLAGKDFRGNDGELAAVYARIQTRFADFEYDKAIVGSVIYANKPGDGSAREQAASCQKVLGGYANIAKEYATKRYRSNLINWGILPLITPDELELKNGDYILLRGARKALAEDSNRFEAYLVKEDLEKINLGMEALTADETQILLAGCLINFNKKEVLAK